MSGSEDRAYDFSQKEAAWLAVLVGLCSIFFGGLFVAGAYEFGPLQRGVVCTSTVIRPYYVPAQHEPPP